MYSFSNNFDFPYLLSLVSNSERTRLPKLNAVVIYSGTCLDVKESSFLLKPMQWNLGFTNTL